MINLSFQRTVVCLLFVASLLGLACGEPSTADRATEAADGRDSVAALQLSDEGHYRVGLRSVENPIPLGRLHGWIVHVETLQGALFTPSLLTIGGGMPQHSHGLVTEPRVTRDLGNGDFLVEGVKFHMTGEWTLYIQIVGPAGGDSATFRVEVEPG